MPTAFSPHHWTVLPRTAYCSSSLFPSSAHRDRNECAVRELIAEHRTSFSHNFDRPLISFARDVPEIYAASTLGPINQSPQTPIRLSASHKYSLPPLPEREYIHRCALAQTTSGSFAPTASAKPSSTTLVILTASSSIRAFAHSPSVCITHASGSSALPGLDPCLDAEFTIPVWLMTFE